MLILTVAAMAVTIFVAMYGIGFSYLNYRRVQAQSAADSAALAAGWYMSNQMVAGTDPATVISTYATQAQNQAVAYAAYNGYTIKPSDVTLNYGSGSNSVYQLHVQVSRTEPLFFGGLFGRSNELVAGEATVNYKPTSNIMWDPTWYGRVNGPLLLSADGPNEGYDGGDLIDSLATTAGGSTPNAAYNKLGEVYQFNIPANYAAMNSKQKNPYNILFEIYDPGIFGKNDELNHPASPGETWDFSLWKGYPRSGGSTEITHMDYQYGAAGDAAIANMWVTPNASWDYNAQSDLQSAGPGGVNYYIEVSSDSSSENDVPGSGAGYFKDGYQLRAGPEHPELVSGSVTNAQGGTSTIVDPAAIDTSLPANSPYKGMSNDNVWENEYGYSPGFSGIAGSNGISGIPAQPKSLNLDSNGHAIQNGVTMQMVEAPSVTCVGATSENYTTVYFGYAPPNPNTSKPTVITFRGWDMDTGAQSIYYTCSTILDSNGNPVHFPGIIGSNATWSNNVNNTITVGAGTPYPYTGGVWTAWYVTGPQDNTTWEWTGNTGARPRAWLISTNATTTSTGIW